MMNTMVVIEYNNIHMPPTVPYRNKYYVTLCILPNEVEIKVLVNQLTQYYTSSFCYNY